MCLSRQQLHNSYCNIPVLSGYINGKPVRVFRGTCVVTLLLEKVKSIRKTSGQVKKKPCISANCDPDESGTYMRELEQGYRNCQQNIQRNGGNSNSN